MILLFTPEFAVLYLNPFDIDQNATNCPTYLNVKFLSLNYFQPAFLLGSEKMFITANGLSVAGAGRGGGRREGGGVGVEECRTLAPSRHLSLAAHPSGLTRVNTD